MSRYDFNVVTCCYTPSGGILRTAAIRQVVASSEHAAKAILVHEVLDAGGWVEEIKRVPTSMPPVQFVTDEISDSYGVSKRYNLSLIIRDDAEYRGGKEVKHNCTASSEQEARRDALERAWANGCLVTRFLDIKVKDLP
jgi:hypothetical protein